MTPNRIIWMNAILFVVIAAIALIIIVEERTLPGKPPVAELQARVEQELANTATDTGPQAAELPNFGKVNLFETVVPLPTPTPPPPKTPVPPPDIREITEFWRLSGALSTMAVFQDTKTKQDFTLKKGEYREEKFKGRDYKIYLKSLTKLKNATVMVTIDGQVQERIIDMVF
jgi:hypothetical protein